MPKKAKNYARRTAKYFNFWRKFFQAVVCKFWYGIQFRLMYRIEIEGTENIPKDNRYIVCSNHLYQEAKLIICLKYFYSFSIFQFFQEALVHLLYLFAHHLGN